MNEKVKKKINIYIISVYVELLMTSMGYKILIGKFILITLMKNINFLIEKEL